MFEGVAQSQTSHSVFSKNSTARCRRVFFLPLLNSCPSTLVNLKMAGFCRRHKMNHFAVNGTSCTRTLYFYSPTVHTIRTRVSCHTYYPDAMGLKISIEKCGFCTWDIKPVVKHVGKEWLFQKRLSNVNIYHNSFLS